MATDLSNMTREAFVGSFVDEVMLQIPLTAMLLEERRVNWNGGTKIQDNVVMATGESNVQMYKAGTGLAVKSKTYTQSIEFGWKLGTSPISYDVDTEIQNQLASSDVKKGDVVKNMTKQGQMGVKLALNTQFHASTAAGDSGTDFQSVPEAAGHNRTYGGFASGTTAAATKWWNGASIAESFADMATAFALSLDNIRKARACAMRYGNVKANQKFYLYLPEGLYSKLIGLVEASHTKIATGSLAKYGFTSVVLYDNIEVVQDSWMTLNSQTGYMYLVNPASFELRIHPSRPFNITPFEWQGKIAGGTDSMLARILFAGNLVCWQPNSNMVKSNVS